MTTPILPTTVTTGSKRSRQSSSSIRKSESGISSTSPSSSSSPETKIARSSRSPDSSSGGDGIKGDRPILCTLPPTCNRHPITLANSKELERHYATYHAHVCEQPGCGCVFPEAKLLELHQTECHDPLALVRKERGEKIFGCMVITCTRSFQSPKARRLHMIEAHKYPKEFFFAVTNKGIGGLLKKWGEGASMIRGEWKPRENEPRLNKGKVQAEGKNDTSHRMAVEDEDDEHSSEEIEEADMEELERTPKPGVRTLHSMSPPRAGNAKANTSTDVDALAEGMSSLTLVPNSIRFGRGGRGGGLGARGRGRGGRGGIVPPQGGGRHQRSSSTSSVTVTKQLESGEAGTSGSRGRGKRGKGHQISASMGAGIEMDVSGDEGGDVVLLPPASTFEAGRGRGGRGKKGGRGGAQ